MSGTVDARALKGWLSEPRELALLDVREPGEFGEGHLFFAVPLPYSRLEIELGRLVPNLAARIVLYDGGRTGERTAERAAACAEALGHRNVLCLAGGAEGWVAAGYRLFKGVNVPSKTFGEIVEERRHTPRITAADLAARQARGDDLVVIDGRPFAEYRKMCIPGGTCCPNGELALRIREMVPRAETTIVVNCAGRTRSIIGAESLRTLGIPNPVFALENGTQGWFLAGLGLEHGADRRYPADVTPPADMVRRARAFAERAGATWVAADHVAAWLADASRTTYVFDVRTPEEFALGTLAGAEHTPGGQLIQASDQWIGVRHARVVVFDSDGVRAPAVAAWLRQLGHEAHVLEGGVASGLRVRRPAIAALPPPPRPISPHDVSALLWVGGATVIDLRPSMSYRHGHIAGSRWSIRPKLAEFEIDPSNPVVLVADDPRIAALAAGDLPAGSDVRLLGGGIAAWSAEGLPLNSSPDSPPDADCIDYLFFTHDRHDGNAAAARQYLAWETGLLAELDDQERGAFRVLVD